MEKEKTLISGIKPTGRPHIGNYFGAMKQFVDLQDNYEKNLVFIADYHAITSDSKKLLIDSNSLDLLLDYLAIGLDPKKVAIFKQSDVPEVTELTWIFSCLVTVPYLKRAHAFKDAENKKVEVNAGTFMYPVLMAADILMYGAEVVPVGKDQKQHLEIARDIARKFNTAYGETFAEPQAFVISDVESVPGNDGEKMSKSYGNHLPLFATEEETKKYIMSVPMDSKEVEEKKNPDDYALYQIYKLFAGAEEDKQMRAKFENGGVGYGDIKKEVAAAVNSYLYEMRERRKQLGKNPEKALEILKSGGKKAKKIAEEKMKEVRKKVGLEIY